VSLRVVFSRRALEDLRELGAWIAANANIVVAERYLNRLRDYCRRFDAFPDGGHVATISSPGRGQSPSSAG
jgi:plasmid stabilization system protein ParE